MALQRSAVRTRLAPFITKKHGITELGDPMLFSRADRSARGLIWVTNIAIYKASAVKVMRGPNPADTIGSKFIVLRVVCLV